MTTVIDTDDLRKIITGETKYRKCLKCDNNGQEYWDETGVSVLPYPHPDWGNNFESGECDTCDGVGFVEIPN